MAWSTLRRRRSRRGRLDREEWADLRGNPKFFRILYKWLKCACPMLKLVWRIYSAVAGGAFVPGCRGLCDGSTNKVHDHSNGVKSGDERPNRKDTVIGFLFLVIIPL